MDNTLEKIRNLNMRAADLCRKDGPQAYKLAKKAHNMLAACSEAEPKDEFECLKTQTYCLDMLSKPEEALPIGLKANKLAEQIGDNYLIGSIQSILGRIYWHIDDYATAMDYYLNAQKLIRSENHPDLEITLINGLGMVQYGLENYPEALGYFKACLLKAKKTDLTGLADANNNIAYVLHLLGQDREAVGYAEAALSLFDQMKEYVGKLHTLHSLGAIHFALRNYDQAMDYLQAGLEIARKNNSQLLELTYVSEISRIYQIEGKLNQAEGELLGALQVAEQINSLTNISLIHERLSIVYKEKQDYRSALEHFEAFHAAYKKIFNEKSDRRIKNLEIINEVESTRKQAELYRELAGTDALTKLINRGHFLEIAEVALQQHNKAQSELTIFLLDIDHFKNVNDQFGHKAGDEVLKGVAESIRKSLRGEDVAGRYGGEEFVVLVTGATAEQSVKIAERIRQAVGRQTYSIEGQAVKVTISLGLCRANSDQEIRLDVLINRADQAMYRAKKLGRNCVVSWTEIEQGDFG